MDNMDNNVNQETQRIPQPEEPGRRKRRRRSRRVKNSGCAGTVVYVIAVLGVSIILSLAAIFIANDVFAFVKDNAVKEVVVSENTNLSDLAGQLDDEGVINYGTIFKLYVRIKGDSDTGVLAGSYSLNPNMDYGQIISELKRANTSTTTVTITIPEGYTIQQIAELLEKGRVCGKGDFIEAANTYDFSHDFLKDVPMVENRLEGYLFPDTYEFYVNERPVSAINKMLNNFADKYTDAMLELTQEKGLTIATVVNIASLIEKEAYVASEQATISGVIWNRHNHADKYPYLDIDAAIMYVTGHKEKLTDEDLAIDSPYNLRKSKGLPPTAICNPGIGALLAAISPEQHDYYYYVADGTGAHIFSRTLEEHNAAVAKVASQG